MKIQFLALLTLLPALLFGQSIDSGGIQKIIDKSIDNEYIFGISLSVSYEDEIQHFASGTSTTGEPYFLASVTKLYTSAVLFKLIDQGKISLDDPISQYLDESVLQGLHVYEGKDYSDDLRIRHLVSHTSGLSDYFEQTNKGEMSLFDRIRLEGDTLLSFEQMIDRAKELPSQFIPGEAGKAFYSDTNFQLLGKILEKVGDKPLEDLYADFLFDPLNLQHTHLYTDVSDRSPANFYYKEKALNIPNMMASFGPDGGMVSNSEESLIFLKAFIQHELFSDKHVSLDANWNKIYSPFQYGTGIMKFKFVGLPEMIGHAGANGSFTYYIPSRQIYISGTINQTDKPQLSYKLIAKILREIKA